MSNLSDELANRGSKLCMQICVNNIEDDYNREKQLVRKSRKHLLDDLIGLGNIQWLSPLTSDSYREYHLESLMKKYPNEINMNGMDWSFWKSNRKPQWDAIGVAPDSTLILVEAKAHTSEMESEGSKATEESRIQIQRQIESVMGTDSVWMGKYYQTANRILYLSKIKEFFGNKRNVLLVFLNFVDDVSLKPEPREKWDSYISKMKEAHPLPKALEENIKYIFMDLWKDKGI